MFKNLSAAYCFIFFPLIVGIMYLGYLRKKRRLARFVAFDLWRKIVPTRSSARSLTKRMIWLFGLACVIVAWMRPQYGVHFEKVTRQGQDIFIALDVSHSMLASDVGGSRFERAKQEAIGLIENLKGDRIGLIVFSGDAYVQCPLTVDYGALRLFLDDIQVGAVAVPGTDLPTAIKVARQSFYPKSSRNKILIVLSDGESFENDPEASAKVAKKEGMKIFTVGIGTPAGEPVPIKDSQGEVSYKKDKQNRVVLSKLDEVVLRKVAVLTDGAYFLSTDGRFVMQDIYKIISQMEKRLIEEKVFQNHKDRYQWVLFLAFLALLFDVLFSERVPLKKERLDRA